MGDNDKMGDNVCSDNHFCCDVGKLGDNVGQCKPDPTGNNNVKNACAGGWSVESGSYIFVDLKQKCVGCKHAADSTFDHNAYNGRGIIMAREKRGGGSDDEEGWPGWCAWDGPKLDVAKIQKLPKEDQTCDALIKTGNITIIDTNDGEEPYFKCSDTFPENHVCNFESDPKGTRMWKCDNENNKLLPDWGKDKYKLISVNGSNTNVNCEMICDSLLPFGKTVCVAGKANDTVISCEGKNSNQTCYCLNDTMDKPLEPGAVCPTAISSDKPLGFEMDYNCQYTNQACPVSDAIDWWTCLKNYHYEDEPTTTLTYTCKKGCLIEAPPPPGPPPKPRCSKSSNTGACQYGFCYRGQSFTDDGHHPACMINTIEGVPGCMKDNAFCQSNNFASCTCDTPLTPPPA